MAVWALIKAAGMPVPETAVTAERAGFAENLSTEQYFRLIRDKREQERQQAQGQAEDDEQQNQDSNGDSDGDDSQEPDDGDGAGDSQASDEDGDQSDDQSESGGEGDQDGGEGETDADGGSDSQPGQEDDVDSAGCDGDGGRSGGQPGDDGEPSELQSQVAGGSCADGQAREWELPPPESDASGQTDTPPAVEQWKQEILLRNAADRVAASGKGSGAGMWREMVEHYEEPKLDPRRLLQKTLAKRLGQLTSGCGKFTYRRPARRPSLGGTLRPRSFQPVPRILVIIDTSGSMSSREMRLGVGLVSKCINALRLQDGVRVMAGDDYAQWDDQVFNPRNIQLIGGGGTDMACLIEAAASKKPAERPELIVVVTDGETGWPKERVPMPVVAAITRVSEYAKFFVPPAWIESVKLY